MRQENITEILLSIFKGTVSQQQVDESFLIVYSLEPIKSSNTEPEDRKVLTRLRSTRTIFESPRFYIPRPKLIGFMVTKTCFKSSFKIRAKQQFQSRGIDLQI